MKKRTDSTRLSSDFCMHALACSPIHIARTQDNNNKYIIESYSKDTLTFIPNFFRAFIMKECWTLLLVSFVSFEMILWFLFLSPFLCCTMYIELHIFNPFYIHGIEPVWSWFIIFFVCFGILFASTLLTSFVSMFIRIIGLQFSSLCLDFDTIIILVSWNKFNSVFPILFCGKVWEVLILTCLQRFVRI